MLARARGIPMVVQLAAVSASAATALLDGEGATLELDPSSEQVGLFQRRRELHHKNRASAQEILRRPAASWDGEKIRLLINIQRVEDIDHPDAQYADGIGLMRTEFLLTGRMGLPDEETQYATYDSVLRWAGDRPVTIRTFDAGGDKPVPGFTEDGEANPFLGVRGLRLCLRHPDVFQCTAAGARARRRTRKSQGHVSDGNNAGGTGSGTRFVCRSRCRLQSEGVDAALPPLGIMVEVPAAALTVSSSKPRSCRSGRTISRNM